MSYRPVTVTLVHAVSAAGARPTVATCPSGVGAASAAAATRAFALARWW